MPPPPSPPGGVWRPPLQASVPASGLPAAVPPVQGPQDHCHEGSQGPWHILPAVIPSFLPSCLSLPLLQGSFYLPCFLPSFLSFGLTNLFPCLSAFLPSGPHASSCRCLTKIAFFFSSLMPAPILISLLPFFLHALLPAPTMASLPSICPSFIPEFLRSCLIQSLYSCLAAFLLSYLLLHWPQILFFFPDFLPLCLNSLSFFLPACLPSFLLLSCLNNPCYFLPVFLLSCLVLHWPQIPILFSSIVPVVLPRLRFASLIFLNAQLPVPSCIGETVLLFFLLFQPALSLTSITFLPA